MSDKPKAYSYIRFSREEQRKGDSIRRQLEASSRYASEHGLILDDSLTMRDEGLSAFRSSHVRKGALGAFLDAVQAGRVAPGSYLLVESLDRLSRDTVLVALRQLMDLVEAGVIIVTLLDRQVYSRESILRSPYMLMGSLTVMIRANEESTTKSHRLSEAWKNKRANASKKPMTARTPEWLRLNRDTSKIEIIQKRADIVRQLYERTIAGSGIHTLTRWLNDSGIEPWGRGKCKAKNGWTSSSVNKILKERKVRGEYQPMKPGDKFKPDGPPVIGYYPAVIDERTWLAAQDALTGRRVGGGRIGVVSNLFTARARCGVCGAPMRHHSSKNGRLNYFICGKAKYGGGCKDASSIQYRELENAFLSYCLELPLSQLLAGDRGNEKLVTARSQVSMLRGKVNSFKKKIANLIEGITEAEDAGSRKALVTAHDRLHSELEGVKLELVTAENQVANLSSTDIHTAGDLSTIKKLFATMETLVGEERIELRKRLRDAVGSILEEMRCFPSGLRDQIAFYDPKDGLTVKPFFRDHAEQVMEKTMLEEHVARNTGRDRACFLVRFKNGHSRLFRWQPDEWCFRMDSEITRTSMVIAGFDFNMVPATGIKII